MKRLLILICLLSVYSVTAQDSIKDDMEALFMQRNYAEALPLYLKAVRTDSSNLLFNYRIGVCYLHSRSQKTKARKYLETATQLTGSPLAATSAEALLAYKLLAEAYQRSFEFDLAIINYEKYKELLDDQKEIDDINRKISLCHLGKALDHLRGDLRFNFLDEKNTGRSLIKNIPDSSSFSLDETYVFNKSNHDFNMDIRYFDEFVKIPVKDSLNDPASEPEKKNWNETSIATSVDGQIVLYYRDENGTANIYATCLNGNVWTKPEKLNKPVNISGWEENECISADGKWMFFTSNRKGGYGGNDIYVCKKLAGNEWSKAQNLGPVINTPFDEEAPFIHPDGTTLYFSSNGRGTKGRFDIYSSVLLNESWKTPLKVGFPIDTTRKDVKEEITEIIVPVTEKSKKARKDKNNIIEVNKTRDNYLISFNNPNGAPLTVLKGEFVFEEKDPGPVKIIIRNNASEENIAVYFSDSLSKKFGIILPPGKTNNMVYQKSGYIAYFESIHLEDQKDWYEKRQAIKFSGPHEKTTIRLNNLFYEEGKPILNSASDIALNDLFVFLKQHPALIVEFTNTISSVENARSFSKLSKERAENIVKILSAKGIEKERMSTRGLTARKKDSTANGQEQMVEMKIIRNNSVNALTTNK